MEKRNGVLRQEEARKGAVSHISCADSSSPRSTRDSSMFLGAGPAQIWAVDDY
ncbi:hypothetical protein ACLOJK_002618, partial [Asimina triloba]